MTGLLDADDATAPEAGDGFERIHQAVACMLAADRARIGYTLSALRKLTANQPPLAMAFSFLVMTELMLLKAGLPLELAQLDQLRSYASDIVERMVAMDPP
jgi:hypothetical protein